MSASLTQTGEKILQFVGLFYTFGYLLLITPPRAIDLTVSQRTSSGELARQPLWVVMLIELLIRVALILLVAVGLESVFGDVAYETYRIDTLFIIIVMQGAFHSLFYYCLLGYLRDTIGLRLAMRIYRLMRNLCYAVIPGFLAVVPLLIWNWKQDHLPFEDGLVFQLYSGATLLMIVLGVIEAMVMKRKPLGLDRHLYNK
jgi:hypothetical protein